MILETKPLLIDTIAALITPPGRGGVGIIRISGSETIRISRLLLGVLPTPRRASYLSFLDIEKKPIDKGIALYFSAPDSLTGEDILELQGHGGPIVLDFLLKQILSLGVRIARPGEFLERAFLNGKIDLTQAEAIADLIDANSMQAARSALRSMQGTFSKLINDLVLELIQIRMQLEASLDFPDEAIDPFTKGLFEEKLKKIVAEVDTILYNATQGSLLRDGMTIVIVGSPNVGKSSLLNQLSGNDSAIVSNIPGTTRDVLREAIHMDGLPVHVSDTAGLRESDDPVEQEGMRRAQNEMHKADSILLMTDSCDPDIEEQLKKIPPSLHAKVTILCNKIDLLDKKACIEKKDSYYLIHLSAHTGEGMSILREHLRSVVGYTVNQEGSLLARRRHLAGLEGAKLHVNEARLQIKEGISYWELCAEELRFAQRLLAEITGEFSSEDFLGEIFSNFCSGQYVVLGKIK